MDSTALLRTLGLWALVILGVALVMRILPIPDSPVLLGAAIAVGYWLVRTYLAREDA